MLKFKACLNPNPSFSALFQMVWEVDRECNPREGAHNWGKDDMVGDVTCLATHRCMVPFSSYSPDLL